MLHNLLKLKNENNWVNLTGLIVTTVSNYNCEKFAFQTLKGTQAEMEAIGFHGPRDNLGMLPEYAFGDQFIPPYQGPPPQVYACAVVLFQLVCVIAKLECSPSSMS